MGWSGHHASILNARCILCSSSALLPVLPGPVCDTTKDATVAEVSDVVVAGTVDAGIAADFISVKSSRLPDEPSSIGTAVTSTFSRSASSKISVNTKENAYITASKMSVSVSELNDVAPTSQRAVTRYHHVSSSIPIGEGMLVGDIVGDPDGCPVGMLVGSAIG